LWLNEGFGTFCEALGMEALGGRTAYQHYIETDIFPDALGTTDSYSIYDPDYYWGATVYEKGAAVMHMLRCLLGDSSFFAALREYGQEHAFGTAVTTQWQAKLEQHYGGSLDWFFQPWVYGTRYPQYVASYIQTDPTFTLAQVQTTPTRFRMPMDVGCIVASGDTVEFTVWTEAAAQQTVTIPDSILSDAVLNLMLDPHNKILKTAEIYISDGTGSRSELPLSFEILAVHPNPFNSLATVNYSLPQPSRVLLRVFDLLGRDVCNTDYGILSTGVHSLAFDGSRLPSGIYLLTLRSAFGTRCVKAVLLK
jgi:aminopeptidase N